MQNKRFCFYFSIESNSPHRTNYSIPDGWHLSIRQTQQQAHLNTREDLSFDASLRAYSETYTVNGAALQVNYSHKRVKEILHPQIAHLVSGKSNNIPQTVFDIFYTNNTLYFYKNTVLIDSYEANNYHILQGNFCMQLLCVLHDKTEDDWLGTIHASTVTNDKEAILVIGKSGREKKHVYSPCDGGWNEFSSR